MKLFNFRGQEVNIYHLQGSKLEYYYNQLLDTHMNSQGNLVGDPNLTIITTYNQEWHPGVHMQLIKWGIPFINAWYDNGNPWYMPDKVYFIREALEKVKTEYVLILDDYDVVINDLVDIIPRFKSYGESTRILYNASKNNYPTVNIDKIPERDYLGEFNHFNAGCGIGYTEDMKHFYSDCIYIHEHPDQFINVYESEQFLLRVVFSNYSERLCTDSPIKFDYDCRVFLCMGNATIRILEGTDDLIVQ